MPNAFTRGTRAEILLAPSRRLYCVWRCRCTKLIDRPSSPRRVRGWYNALGRTDRQENFCGRGAVLFRRHRAGGLALRLLRRALLLRLHRRADDADLVQQIEPERRAEGD